jgi:hypothetical protein
MKKQFLIILFSIFALLTGLLYIVHMLLPAYSFMVLEGGNVLLLSLTLAAFLMLEAQSGKPGMAYIRGITGVSFMKMMVCLIAAGAYIFANKEHIHKPSIFVLFGLYIIYSILEKITLSRMARGGAA